MFILLFIVLLAGYVGIHYYLYRKLNDTFTPSRAWKRRLALFLIVMVAAPFATRVLDHGGHAALARLLNLPIFIWMAWLFWFFMGGVATDLWNALFRAFPAGAPLVIPARRQLAGLATAILLATGWSYIEGLTPRINTITIHHPALPATQPIRVVQVSDVHLGMMRSENWNRMICNTIESLKPDLLVSTGDMLDTSMKNIGHQADPWSALHPPLGKFAVLGNHEYYLGLADSLAFHQRAGFHVLRQETRVIGDTLLLGGIDDRDGKRLGRPCFDDESVLNPVPDRNTFSILLKHQPIVLDPTMDRFNLQLSGHTHNGQLFPFHWFVWLYHRYPHGMYQPRPDFQIYVSSGTGTWGPPLRFLAPPEITVLILQR